ncbi:hypothetical protein HMPREF9413_3124 [Paenibacillus sp. HGF7]|nr:hypothetical protein HMPREF9413_3124 [Paenibacillus sp. HGF7]
MLTKIRGIVQRRFRRISSETGTSLKKLAGCPQNLKFSWPGTYKTMPNTPTLIKLEKGGESTWLKMYCVK